MPPEAYAYPKQMRSTRDLLRRRLHLVRRHAELLAHIQNTRHQYNMPAFSKQIARGCNRVGIADSFDDPMVDASVQVDTNHLDALMSDPLYVFGSGPSVTPSPNESQTVTTYCVFS